jgi:nucleoside transporter
VEQSLRIRLSIMMFLQYFVWGAWAVTLGTFLSGLPTAGGLLFPGDAVGWIYATSSIGAMISPLFVGLFADRLFSTERVLGVLHLVGAVLLGWAAWHCAQSQPLIQQEFEKGTNEVKVGDLPLKEARAREKEIQDRLAAPPSAEDNAALETELAALQKQIPAGIDEVKARPEFQTAVAAAYQPLFWIMLAYALCYMPTLTLTNSISFRNMSDPDKYFGGIRVLGTIGWIIAGWVVGFGLNALSVHPIYLAAGSSALLGLFCFALPHTPPSSEAKTLGDALGLPALAMLKSPSFLVFFLCSFLIMIPLAFYYAWANKFLTDIHAPFPAAIQTLGQISEIFFMLAIPFCLAKFGTKWMLIIGMLAWVVRYAVFASLNVPLIIAIGLPLHGICYDFFFVVSYLYVDRKAPKHLRASAQGIITFITLGVGQGLGNWVGGVVKNTYAVGDTIDYQKFWLIPLAIAAVATVLFAAFFWDKVTPAADKEAAEGKEPVRATDPGPGNLN